MAKTPVDRLLERKAHDVLQTYETVLHADTLTPLTVLLTLFDPDEPCALLESADGAEEWGRYSFFARGAVKVFAERGDVGAVEGLAALRAMAESIEGLCESPAGSERFGGGAIGYLSYESVRLFEPTALDGVRGDRPLFRFFVPRVLLTLDRIRMTCRISVFYDDSERTAKVHAWREMGRIAGQLAAADNGGRPWVEQASERTDETPAIESNMTEAAFCAAVERAREYIRAGDVFQVVLSQRFELASTPRDLLAVYRRLRRQNPSPYLFFIHWPDDAVDGLGGETLIGASPEVMVRVADGEVHVRPIAGTRPRGVTSDEDARLEADLLRDEKERAEHIMLVDLGRNDVGRVARPGTVEVTERMVVERYSRVMHLVSHVKGALADGSGWLEAFAAAFPAGTLTGAPKIRAMEIISELESTPRGAYGGAVGYIGFDGTVDFCIAIRMLELRDGRVSVQAGAGIVADSVPSREYEETQNKARALLDAIGG